MPEKGNIFREPLLTIAIPTFNRAAKLKRLLAILLEEITTYRLEEQIAVMISDNASQDETPSIASGFAGSFRHFIYYIQDKNSEFDGNCRFLYAHAYTKYVWFMADDDMPLKGAIFNIVNAISTHLPDVLLFSFIQPPGSKFRQFNYSETIHIITNPVEAIDHVLRYTKVSIYIMRKVYFSGFQWQELDKNLGGGWYYISLAFSVLESSQNLLLAVISQPLAKCDEDFINVSFNPNVFLYYDKIVKHQFVLKHRPEVVKRYPNLIKLYEEKGYYTAIQFSFAAKCGSLTPECVKDYDDFIRELDCRIIKLLKHPRSLFQFIAIKLRVASLWPKIRPSVRWVKALFLSGNGNM